MANALALAEAKLIAEILNSESGRGPHAGGSRRLDADETVALALQLEQMRTRAYEAEFPELKARQILPFASDVSPSAESFAWVEKADAGDIKEISGDGFGDDPPSTELLRRKQSRPIADFGGVVNYTLADMRRSAMLGESLDQSKVLAMRRTYEQNVDAIAATGKDIRGRDTSLTQFGGVANQTVGTGAGQIRNTAMTSAAWDATPDAAVMISDLSAAVAAMVSDSKETQTPNTLILPTLEYIRLHQTYTSDGNPETAAERFLRSNGFISRIFMWDKFKSVDGGGNGSRGLILNSDADVVEVVNPMEFTVLPAQVHNFAFKILGYGRTAGTIIHRPLGMRYLTALPNT